MFLRSLEINAQTTVSEIVAKNYRTAVVFRKYGIEYCCGGRWPLETVCMMKGIEIDQLSRELHEASRTTQLSGAFPFKKWNLDFLADYIINVHHAYLEKTLPELEPILNRFIEEHLEKYPYFAELNASFNKLKEEILPHLKEEEDSIFPYIRQVARAWKNKDTYAGLLVKTLRKPVNTVMEKEHEIVSTIIFKWRELTDNYTPPEKACITHRVVLAKLKELDNDLAQHIFLENEILFPAVLKLEKEIMHL